MRQISSIKILQQKIHIFNYCNLFFTLMQKTHHFFTPSHTQLSRQEPSTSFFYEERVILHQAEPSSLSNQNEFRNKNQFSSETAAKKEQQTQTTSEFMSVNNRKRRHSFIELENSHSSKIHKMIRNQFKTDEGQKDLEEQDGQTTVCSSMVHERCGNNWKNRQLAVLTTTKLKNCPIGELEKVKIKREEPLIGCKSFRFCYGGEKSRELAIGKSDIRSWFSNVIWLFLVEKGYNLTMESMWSEKQTGIQDEIYKKSEILGRWEKRYAKIDHIQGFTSAKDKKSEASFSLRQTNQLWTRFESATLEGEEWVIFKFWWKFFKAEIAVRVKNAAKWGGNLAGLIL